MARPLRLEHPGAIWHVTSRGNERRDIYFDDRDRLAFVDILAGVVARYDWIVHSWVLMRNHYHILLETPRVPTLSRGVKRLNESYSRHVNSRYSRVGHVFQGRFKSVLVERESHLLELTRYIVLNPVRCGAVTHAGDWEWSNYRATAGLAPVPTWLEVDWTLAQFDERIRLTAHEKYRRFVADGRGATYNPWEDLVGQIYLGGAAFCDRVQQLVDAKARSREHPRGQRRPVLPTFDEVVARVSSEFCGGSVEALRRPSRRPARKALAVLAWAEGDVAMAAIGEWLGVTPGAISKLIRSSDRLERVDEAYREQLGVLREALRAPRGSCEAAPAGDEGS